MVEERSAERVSGGVRSSGSRSLPQGWTPRVVAVVALFVLWAGLGAVSAGASVGVAEQAPSPTATGEITPRADPAAERLREVTFAFLGAGGVILILTVAFWKATRPALLNANVAGSSATPPASPPKIPAALVLASPAASAADPAELSADDLTEPISLDEAPPPSGTPVFDAPPPLGELSRASRKPLVGNDSAWIIEPESPSGLIPEKPTAGNFRASDSQLAPAVESEPIEAHLVGESEAEPGPATTKADPPSAPQSLIAALAAIPDQEPTRVRFDDPPVQRVPPRRRKPSGAPNFDRQARSLDPGAVDDMAVMASALSSVPARPADFPPTGEFYDQDLDPGDPPGSI